jgi:hypothetical protein
LDNIHDFAERVVDSLSSSSTGGREDVTFVPPNSVNAIGQFPGYKPVAVSPVVTDYPVNAVSDKPLRPEGTRKYRSRIGKLSLRMS